MKINGLNFVCTCNACPEQYDVKDENGNTVGYVRLRWGGLYCEYPWAGGEVIYTADIGDGWTGCFENKHQRTRHLTQIAKAIQRKLNEVNMSNEMKGWSAENLIMVADSDDFTVHYDQSRGMYRVSIFEDCHFQDEYWFDACIPTGHWIDHGPDIECSACGFTCNDEWYLGEAVACPNCGVQMKGREYMGNIQYE